MLNNASKFALGVAGLAVIAALFAEDQASAIVLVGVAITAGVIAFGIGRTVGADLAPFVAPDAVAASTVLEPSDIGGASVGPLFAAVGITVGIAGGALGPYWVLFGGLVALVGSALWLVDTFRTPGVVAARDAANVDYRFFGPLGLPVASTITAITIAYCLSRVLLAVNETASWVIAFIVAASTLAVLSLIAAKAPAAKLVAGLAGVSAVVTLVIGGVFAGAGEREFENHGDHPPAAEITAQNIAYDRKVIALPADADAVITFTNLDIGTFHNVAVYTEGEPGNPIYNGRPSAKGVEKYTFRTPSAGTYRYVCDFHPAMVGELRVTEAAPSSEHASNKESEH